MRRSKLWTLPLLVAAPFALAMDQCGGRPSVQFAVVLPLTGEGQVYGESIRNGIELAYELHGQDPQGTYEIKLAVEDSATDPEKAQTLLAGLYGSSLAAIGGVTSDEALAMVEAADAADKVLLSPSASSPELSGVSTNFFRIFPNSKDEAVAMANFATETLQVDQLVMVMEQTAYGGGLAGAMVEVFEGEIVATLTFTGQDDVDAVAKEAVELGSKAIYVAADGVELAAMLRALRAAGFDNGSWILSSSALANPRVVDLAEGAAEGSFLSQTVFDPTSQEEPMRTFTDQYQAKYGVLPDYFAAHGYDAMLVFLEALKEGQGTMASEFMKGMRSINNFPATTGNIQFRESGDVQKFMRVFYISGGQLQDYTKLIEQRKKELEERRREIERRRRELLRNS